MTFTFAEGADMSDPIPRDGGHSSNEDDDRSNEIWQSLPPENLPEELLQARLGRLDTRKALADLCKNIPGLEEILLPRGIQADALTRKSGGGGRMVRDVSRRIKQYPAAWDAFRTAVRTQIPPETLAAVESMSVENIEELSEAHGTENLLVAAITHDDDNYDGEDGENGGGTLGKEALDALIEAWSEASLKAEQRASKDAHVKELEAEVESLRRENEQLSFASRAARQQAESLSEEVRTLTGERDGDSAKVREARERAESAVGERERLDARIMDLEKREAQLTRSLEGERRAYSKAAERVDEMHAELGEVGEERDRIQDALRNARFTDKGFGELLVRAVKNEVSSLPNSLESSAQTARLLDFMGKVLHAHNDLRGGREPGGSPASRTEDPDDSEPSTARGTVEAVEEFGSEKFGSENGGPRKAESKEKLRAKPRPTLSFQAIGGAGEVGGASHLLDFGSARVLIDAGIKPDGRGPAAPAFEKADGLDAAIITHAHLDHCGALPLLMRMRPGLPIYCTPPSARLIANALNDHAAMGGSIPGGVPIHEVEKRLIPVPFGKPFEIGGVKATLTESGHILGAASVLLESGSARVFHTGDICMEDHFSIPSAKLPDVRDIDLLIMEATLADQTPQPFSESVKTMVEVVNDTTMNRGGTVLIPTYALGQAQEIILGLKHYAKELDKDAFIYVDGSVVTMSERLYAEQIGYMKPYLQQSDPREVFFSENIRAVANDDAARERILTSPCAIIASPVTMQGGASGFYRQRLEKNKKNAVILPSNAAAAYGATAAGEERQWRVERVSFAAHCTQGELVGITEKLSPRQIILVHGSKRRISDLAFRLAPNHKIHTPSVGETVRTVL
ncbi:MAG: MBL fold metallo-hydrolase [Actinomycetota bacterium]|jgi:Cft2 family RNA processing exonuclease|nr:MBL fold metallo-hydrolase [Actinomycetota bacterium]